MTNGYVADAPHGETACKIRARVVGKTPEGRNIYWCTECGAWGVLDEVGAMVWIEPRFLVRGPPRPSEKEQNA